MPSIIELWLKASDSTTQSGMLAASVDSAVQLALLGGSSEQLERLRHAKDVADLLLQIAIEVSMDRDLRDEIG